MDFRPQFSESHRGKPNPVTGHKIQSLSRVLVEVVGERLPLERRIALHNKAGEGTLGFHVHRYLLTRDYC